MITREEISNAYKYAIKYTENLPGSALIINGLADLRDLCEKLLFERDEALKAAEEEFQNADGKTEMKRWFQKELVKERMWKDAYREVAILKSAEYLNYGDYENVSINIDAETKRFIENYKLGCDHGGEACEA